MNNFSFKTTIKLVVTIMLSIYCIDATSQTKVTFSGYVKDSLTGETLIGANIQFQSINKGVTCNNYGFFSITIPSNSSYTFTVTYSGYRTKYITLNQLPQTTYSILLSPLSQQLDSVIVIGKKRDNNVKTAQMGKVDLSISTIKTLPSFLGEVDVLKSIQLLPGVRNAGEGNAGFYVRGGGPDQNLILLDDAVVYNTGHLFGFFSVFNPDAIKNVTLIKGGMPAQYGGRLSSVVDISMKEGNMNKPQVDAGIGLISSRFSVQAPIVKNKASFIISARRTYIDVLTKPFIDKSEKFKGSAYYFYDLNAKINYILSKKDRLYLSGYFGQDRFTFNNASRDFSTKIPWGNSTASLRWNHIFNSKLFVNTTVVYNDYNFEFGGKSQSFNVKLNSGIKDWNIKTDFDWFVNPEHKLKFGAMFTYHTFLPNIVTGSQDTVKFEPNNAAIKYAREYALYIQDDWEIGKKVKLNYGLRFTAFEQVGRLTAYTKNANGDRIDSTVFGDGQVVQSYSGLEPRATLRYELADNQSLKFAVTRNYQYIHLVSNSGTTLPTDLWVPSTYRVKPQISWQYAAGYFRNFKNGMFETSVEIYYKNMENQIEYREGYTPNTIADAEENFVFGRGWSYGAEFFINKVKGRLTGWLGYTLSWTNRQFPDLNSGNVYPAKYDRRHDLSLVGMYQLNDKWKLSAVFVYGSGNAMSMPERFYFVNGILTQQYSKINAYRMPDYHRLDFAATYTPKHKKKRKYEDNWVFSIYNVYSRQNPYFIYFDQSGSIANGGVQVQAKQVSLFPIIPSVTWNVKF